MTEMVDKESDIQKKAREFVESYTDKNLRHQQYWSAWSWGLYKDVIDLISQERERCAKIVEEMSALISVHEDDCELSSECNCPEEWRPNGKEIAQKIRAGERG